MITAIWNGKGGCGKTATAVGIAGRLAQAGGPVYLVDLDPQTTASGWLLEEIPDGPGTLELLTARATLHDASYPVPDTENLFVVPASPRLTRIAIELEDDPVPQLALRRALAGVTGTVVLDCPPAFGELPVMALAAADTHIVPLRHAPGDMEAAEATVRRAGLVREQLNPTLRLAGFVLSQFDARTSVAGAVEAALIAAYPEVPVVRVPSAVVVMMAHGAHQLLDTYAPLSPATIAIQTLTDQIVRRTA